MSKKINKHTADSEELFNRLETGDDAGLDDFEKEALEGFTALNDVKLAEKLNEGLNAKINEVYFKPAAKKNNLAYLSMAAGLLLMVGVSVFFYQYLNEEKKDMAFISTPKTEPTVMENMHPTPEEKLDAVSAAEQEPQKTTVTVIDKITQKQAPKDSKENESDYKTEIKSKSGEGIAQDDQGTNTGASVSVPPAIAEEVIKNQVSQQSKLAAKKANQGPSGQVLGGAGGKDSEKKLRLEEKEKSKQETEVVKEEAPETNTNENLAKNKEDRDANDKKPVTDSKDNDEFAAVMKSEDNENSSNRAKSKFSRRDASKGVSKKGKMAESPNAAPAKTESSGNSTILVFYSSKHSTVQDYLKSEIEKDEVLKKKVKDFKAKLVVDESGKVVKVNFITGFKKCDDCDERLGKILLNMEGWNSSKQTNSLDRETYLSFPK